MPRTPTAPMSSSTMPPNVMPWTDTDQLAVNTIRALSMDAVQQANSGHPGAPMGLAPLAYTVWARHLKMTTADPLWPDRDRFVLSCGHASMLLYSLLHLSGFDVSLDDIKAFRQWGSRTPGHPEYGHTAGVETTTGPLGQGLANAVGMAIAEARLRGRFNRPGFDVVDHRTIVLASDGDMMEGVAHEASALAGHLRLGRLIVCYDDNRITIDGGTELTHTEDVAKRYAAYGWHVLRVDDGNDLAAIDHALSEAAAEEGRPSLVIVRTHIGFGSPNRQDTSKAHGEPLGEDEVALSKQNLGWSWTEPFHVPKEAAGRFRDSMAWASERHDRWRRIMESYRSEYPELAADLERSWRGDLPEHWDRDLPEFPGPAAMATRKASGQVLNALAKAIPELVGGSADLAGSNNAIIEDTSSLTASNLTGRNIHFGVREHAMGSIANGLALHGGQRPFTATFLVFSDYMRPAIRLAAIMKVPVTFIFTHDSIGVGEDGPTHQPVEHLAALRAIPNLVVLRPGDPNEVREAWRVAMQRRDGPTALVLTRQKVATYDGERAERARFVGRGAFVLDEASTGRPRLLLLASGSEVDVALGARKLLEAEGIPTRVVSFPSWELFREQSPEYRDEVLPHDVEARLAIEAGVSQGWAEWLGSRGAAVCIDRYGASAPGTRIFQEFGFTGSDVARRAKELL